MDVCVPEADSSRGGALARGLTFSDDAGDWFGPGALLSVDFHGVFAGPHLWVSCVANNVG